MKHTFFSICILFFSFFTSCDSGSGIKPDVDISSPLPDARFWVGSQINVSASLTNDGLIDQYKVELKLSAPCEPLDSASSGVVLFGNHSFLFVSGTNYNQSHISANIPLPLNFTPGKYHLIVSALNNQFNEGRDTLVLTVMNSLDTVPPQLTLSSPMEGSNWTLGDTLRIVGTINETLSDLNVGGMHRLVIWLVPQFDGLTPIQLFNSTQSSLVTIDVKYYLGATLPVGNYILRITAIDEFNNVTPINIGLTVVS
ncbi:MAG: DUF4625 domain-containing protein [Candidatus Competibacteraceae bacterium]|nr:DUF4625 domain-containing protein [Candidatus Competibacteraceae bacterium]